MFAKIPPGAIALWLGKQECSTEWPQRPLWTVHQAKWDKVAQYIYVYKASPWLGLIANLQLCVWFFLICVIKRPEGNILNLTNAFLWGGQQCFFFSLLLFIFKRTNKRKFPNGCWGSLKYLMPPVNMYFVSNVFLYIQ